MARYYRTPVRSDFETEEEYLEALEAYDDAMDFLEDMYHDERD